MVTILNSSHMASTPEEAGKPKSSQVHKKVRNISSLRTLTKYTNSQAYNYRAFCVVVLGKILHI
jgi:hypothetical protein